MGKQEKKEKQGLKNNNVRVTSIARKINLQHVKQQLLSFFEMDVIFCCALILIGIYVLDVQYTGEFEISRYRSLLGGEEIQELVYQVEEIGSDNDVILYRVELGHWVLPLRNIGIAILIYQTIRILQILFVGTGAVRQELNPLNEIAQKAKQLSQMGFKETKYHNLEDAIASYAVEKPDARIHMHDKELQGIETALNDLLERMHASYHQQVQFVSDASHELRTPIAVIQGYANMLDRWGKEDPAVLEESISAIKNESDHMKKLVEQLLFLARGDSNRHTLQMEQIDLNQTMKEVYEESMMIDEKHPYFFEESGQAVVWGDSAMLKQSARILLENAAKYTADGEDIVIRVGCISPGKVFYSVQDNGIGMCDEDIEHVFDRFYRADSVRNSKTGGSGLGLSIARWIIEEHRGYVEVLSREGIGTRFSVVFPEYKVNSGVF